MNCTEPGCTGEIENGKCQVCGASAQKWEPDDASERQATISSVRRLLEPREVAPTKENLAEAAQTLKTVVPYNFEAWRLHADVLLNALQLLKTRQLQPDASFTLLAIPLREDDLRDAAEEALRQCAHFASSNEQKIALVDEANMVRRTTWF